jgi:hypothetical protein
MPSESEGGDPRNNAEDAYLTFMEMSDSTFQAVFDSIMFGGGAFGPAENEGFKRAFHARFRFQTKIDRV